MTRPAKWRPKGNPDLPIIWRITIETIKGEMIYEVAGRTMSRGADEARSVALGLVQGDGRTWMIKRVISVEPAVL